MCWQLGRLVLTLLLSQVIVGATDAPVAAATAFATPVAAASTPGGALPSGTPAGSPPSAPMTPTPDATSDGQTVFCMKSKNARDLIDTATALGLARGGKSTSRLRPASDPRGADLTIAAWRQRQPSDFRRACAALLVERAMTKASPDPGGASETLPDKLGTALLGLISVVVGAGLTLGSTVLTTGKATSQRAASDLHTAATNYHRACRACLDEWRRLQGKTLEAEMNAPLDVLTMELGRTTSRRPSWRRPAKLRKMVKQLDSDIRQTNWPEDATKREKMAKKYLDRLDKIQMQALTVAAALEHPWRHRREMRAK